MRLVIAFGMLAPLGGCAYLESDIGRVHDRSAYFSIPAAYMTADARIVTQRIHPVTSQTVVCVEPPPDAIRAVSNSGAAGLKGGNGAITGGIDFSGTSGEAAAQLAGRSTALLGLREGLFRACEAYSNGVIGASAYGLILSKYAPTMTTLFLAQDVTGAAGVAEAALAASAAAPGSSAGAGDSSEAPAPKAKKESFLTSPLNGLARVWPIADIPAPHPAPKPKPKPKPGKQSASDAGGADAAPADPSAVSAAALVRMNEDYMLQPQSIISTLLVACIEENDPSRMPVWSGDTPAKELPNTFLKTLCDDMNSIQKIKEYAEEFGKMAKEARFVEVGASGSTHGQKSQGK